MVVVAAAGVGFVVPAVVEPPHMPVSLGERLRLVHKAVAVVLHCQAANKPVAVAPAPLRPAVNSPEAVAPAAAAVAVDVVAVDVVADAVATCMHVLVAAVAGFVWLQVQIVVEASKVATAAAAVVVGAAPQAVACDSLMVAAAAVAVW